MCSHIRGRREGKSTGDAAGAAGEAEGGAEAPAGNAGQQQGHLNHFQPLPQPSRNSTHLNDITNDTIKPFVSEIGTALGEIKKNISSASYRVKKMDELIPKINQSLSQQHHPGGPVVSSYVNQCMSAISTIKLIAQKVEESSDSMNINLDLIQNTEDLQGFYPNDY